MNEFKIVDERGDTYTYEASDMRAALTVHFMLHRTEAVKAKLIPSPTKDHT